jgi:hypothetical protein
MTLSSLDELVAQLYGSVPKPELLCEIDRQPALDGVTFKWFSTRFFAKPSLEVFEIRGQKLYITPSSVLLQTVISAARLKREALNKILVQLQDTENVLLNGRQINAAAKALQSAREAVERDIGSGSHSDTRRSPRSSGIQTETQN